MDWNPPVVQPAKELAILVVDLHHSTPFLVRSLDQDMLEFLRQVSQAAHKSISSLGRQRLSEAHIVKFTGDGFLMLFEEPQGGAQVQVAAGRAVAVAKELRRRVRELCSTWNRPYRGVPQTGRLPVQSVGLVSGVVVGDVHYGPIAAPAVPLSDAAGEPVVRAFRLAQERRVSEPGRATRDIILICNQTKAALQRFCEHPEFRSHESVSNVIDGITYREVSNLTLKGIASAACHLAVWPERPTRAVSGA